MIFLDRAGLPRLHEAELPLPPLRGFLGGQKIRRRLADKRLWRHLQISRRDRIDQDELSGLVLNRHSDRKLFDDRGEQNIIGAAAKVSPQNVVEPPQFVAFGASVLAAAQATKGQRQDGVMPGQNDMPGTEAWKPGTPPQDQSRALSAHRQGEQQDRLAGSDEIGRNRNGRVSRALSVEGYDAAADDFIEQRSYRPFATDVLGGRRSDTGQAGPVGRDDQHAVADEQRAEGLKQRSKIGGLALEMQQCRQCAKLHARKLRECLGRVYGAGAFRGGHGRGTRSRDVANDHRATRALYLAKRWKFVSSWPGDAEIWVNE